MAYCKVVLFISLLYVAFVLGDSDEDQRKEYLDTEMKALTKCVKEGNHPNSYINEMHVKEVAPPNSGCFVKCVFENLNFLNKDGYPDLAAWVDGMKRLFIDSAHENEAIKIVNVCFKKVSKNLNKCDSSFQILDCIYKGKRTDTEENVRSKYLDIERTALTKCVKEGNYPESYIDDIYVKEVVPHNSGCFVKCVFENMDYLNKEGYPDLQAIVDGMKRLFIDPTHEDAAVQVVKDCFERVPKGTSQCDSSFLILYCMGKGHETEGDLADVLHSEGY